MKYFCFLLLFAFAGMPNLIGQSEDDYKSKSLEVLQFLQHDNVDSLYQMFDENVKSMVKKSDFSGVFTKLTDTYGEFVKTGKFESSKHGEYTICSLELEFENEKLDLKMTFNKDMQVAGIFFNPNKSSYDYELVNNEILTEEEIVVESGKYKLPGIICKPKNLEKFDIVVLVHGSGPNDKNMTTGPNKIFKDIAHKLAKEGIATIRYDKRTFVYKDLNVDSVTLEETTIEDALAALKLASQQNGVERVFVLGHSLGAMSAPRIAQRSENLSGLIMLAGNASPLHEIIIDQYKYIYSKDGLSKGEKQMIKEIKRKSKNVSKIDENSNFDASDLSLNQNQYYWNYMINYNQVETLKEIELPVFIAQGERDYQVPMKEFEIWQKKLKNKSNIFFKSYPKLNHLFIEGEGKSYPDEYKKKGEFAGYVIDDIANWIKKL